MCSACSTVTVECALATNCQIVYRSQAPRCPDVECFNPRVNLLCITCRYDCFLIAWHLAMSIHSLSLSAASTFHIVNRSRAHLHMHTWIFGHSLQFQKRTFALKSKPRVTASANNSHTGMNTNQIKSVIWQLGNFESIDGFSSIMIIQQRIQSINIVR